MTHVSAKRIMRVKVNPDYEILFRLMDGLQPDAGRRYWIKEYGAEGDIGDMGEELGQLATEASDHVPEEFAAREYPSPLLGMRSACPSWNI